MDTHTQMHSRQDKRKEGHRVSERARTEKNQRQRLRDTESNQPEKSERDTEAATPRYSPRETTPNTERNRRERERERGNIKQGQTQRNRNIGDSNKINTQGHKTGDTSDRKATCGAERADEQAHLRGILSGTVLCTCQRLLLGIMFQKLPR